MASITPIVFKKRRKRDGTFSVFIRVTHNRRSTYINTGVFAFRHETSREGRITSPSLIAQLLPMVEAMRSRLDPLTDRELSARQLADRIRPRKEPKADILEAANTLLLNYQQRGSHKTAANVKVLIKHLTAYKPHIIAKDIDARWLQGFETHLRSTCGDRGVQMNMSLLRRTYDIAAETYNTPDCHPVPPSPFGTTYKIPTAAQTRKRDVGPDTIRKIASLPDLDGRAALARDVFLLSFCLCGMNTVDLYSVEKSTDGKVRGQRSKTKHRRDGAHFEITMPDSVIPWAEKNTGHDGLLFNFAEKYSNHETFNAAVNKGLKEVGNLVGVNGLTFYAARHTWASTAVNDCHIPKDVVAQALVHAANDVTELYINRRSSTVDEANTKVIETVFGSNPIFR